MIANRKHYYRPLSAAITQLRQALKAAQAETEQLTAENLNLHEGNGDSHDGITSLKSKANTSNPKPKRLTLPPSVHWHCDWDE